MTPRLAVALLLVGTLPAAATPRPAAQPDRFDGTWSVEIITEAGTCDRAYRYPVRIERGRARFIGTAFTVEGGVARNGAIRGTISNGAATADVRGRLGSDGFGAGTWVASGALACRGHWNAERRG
ncbi:MULTISPECIES: large exoprotein involved in heme utilization or adhesion [Methylobacterium]|uniref:large exoprotein involved in heme utilization or adhesion n=1 Tax=Methylobacterium TaxID=407 RepID=UPI0008D96F1C|nr:MULTISPECIES: large exoprotein involved in heme utilization or adhesion [Methylobacterium]ONF49306.1 large exoprotein involved in heme utilization or adhesion [Methylobacterium radiotolerans]